MKYNIYNYTGKTIDIIDKNDGTSSHLNSEGLAKIKKGKIVGLPKEKESCSYIVNPEVVELAKKLGRKDCIAYDGSTTSLAKDTASDKPSKKHTYRNFSGNMLEMYDSKLFDDKYVVVLYANEGDRHKVNEFLLKVVTDVKERYRLRPEGEAKVIDGEVTGLPREDGDNIYYVTKDVINTVDMHRNDCMMVLEKLDQPENEFDTVYLRTMYINKDEVVPEYVDKI